MIRLNIDSMLGTHVYSVVNQSEVFPSTVKRPQGMSAQMTVEAKPIAIRFTAMLAKRFLHWQAYDDDNIDRYPSHLKVFIISVASQQEQVTVLVSGGMAGLPRCPVTVLHEALEHSCLALIAYLYHSS